MKNADFTISEILFSKIIFSTWFLKEFGSKLFFVNIIILIKYNTYWIKGISGEIYHDEPQILHYGTPGTGIELKEGMTFTIEPMINSGKATVRLLSDEWTVVTKDHSLSAQWEHTILVTNNGYEVLTLAPNETI